MDVLDEDGDLDIDKINAPLLYKFTTYELLKQKLGENIPDKDDDEEEDDDDLIDSDEEEEDEEEDEEEENAYAELVEYLRVATQLIYEELADFRTPDEEILRDESDTLHWLCRMSEWTEANLQNVVKR